MQPVSKPFLPYLTDGWPIYLALAGLGLVYAVTLMRGVSSCQAEYCLDVGEFQVALATWGTVHHTGYPLYMLLGSPFVTALQSVGIAPSLGASVYSLTWQMGASLLIGLFVLRVTQHTLVAAASIVATGVMAPVWVHATLAEVYSLSNFLLIALIGLTHWARSTWSPWRGCAVALVAGLAVAHHRLLLMPVLCAGLYLLPVVWRSQARWMWLLGSVLAFALGFAPYLDMVARAASGADFVYGRPDTWEGFWFIFFGQEVADLQRPLNTAEALDAALLRVGSTVTTAAGLPLLVVTLVAGGLAWREPGQRPLVAFIAAIVAITLVFSVVLQRAVLLEATLLPALIGFALLAALGIGTLTGVRRALAAMLWLAGAIALVPGNLQAVGQLTGDTRNSNLAVRLEQATKPGASIMLPWGSDFFAVRYAQLVDGRLRDRTLVDHRADVAAVAAASDGPIYTTSTTPYVFGVAWWRDRFGPDMWMSSAGEGILAIGAVPPPMARVTRPQPIGAGVRLDDWAVSAVDAERKLTVTLYWAATRRVTAAYSTYVHVSDQSVDTITSPEQLVAQSDSAAPVYGWYPTTAWAPGVWVREDHTLSLPEGRQPSVIFVGMYQTLDDGTFQPLGSVRLIPEGNEWINSR